MPLGRELLGGALRGIGASMMPQGGGAMERAARTRADGLAGLKLKFATELVKQEGENRTADTKGRHETAKETVAQRGGIQKALIENARKQFTVTVDKDGNRVYWPTADLKGMRPDYLVLPDGHTPFPWAESERFQENLNSYWSKLVQRIGTGWWGQPRTMKHIGTDNPNDFYAEAWRIKTANPTMPDAIVIQQAHTNLMAPPGDGGSAPGMGKGKGAAPPAQAPTKPPAQPPPGAPGARSAPQEGGLPPEVANFRYTKEFPLENHATYDEALAAGIPAEILKVAPNGRVWFRHKNQWHPVPRKKAR